MRLGGRNLTTACNDFSLFTLKGFAMKQPPLKFMWTKDPHALREIGSIATNSIPRWKQNPAQRLRVAKMGGKVVAYVQFGKDLAGGHLIENVFVGWDHRGRGIGTAIMRDALQSYFKTTPGADRVEGVVIDDYFDEAAARHIYEKIGGEPTDANSYVFRRVKFLPRRASPANPRPVRPRKV